MLKASELIGRSGTFGFHFLGVNGYGKLILRNGTVIEDEDAWLPEIDSVELCQRGYHGSEELMHALSYAPDGRAMCLVEAGGTVVHGSDKWVAQTRRILARIDVHPLLVTQCAEPAARFAASVAKVTRELSDTVTALQQKVVRGHKLTAEEKQAVRDEIASVRAAAVHNAVIEEFEAAVASAVLSVLGTKRS